MPSDAQRRAARRYRKHVKSFVVTVNPRTEAAVYRRLLEVENMSGYVKALVAQDIARSRQGLQPQVDFPQVEAIP